MIKEYAITALVNGLLRIKILSYKDQKSTDGVFNTPRYLFNYLHKFFHFHCDPCDSGDRYLKLPFHFTKYDDGLKQDWLGNTFVNPPYGNENENKWIKKAFEQYNKHGNTIFLILPAKTESNWFAKMMINSDVIIFPRPRIAFIRDGKVIHGNNIGTVLFGLRSKNKYGMDSLIDFLKYNVNTLEVEYDIIGDNRFILYPDTKILKREFLGNIAS